MLASFFISNDRKLQSKLTSRHQNAKKFQNFELGHKTPKNPIISMTTHFSRFFSSIVRGNRSKGLTVGWSRKNMNTFDQNA